MNLRAASSDTSWEDQLDDRTIERRKAWLSFSAEDEQLVGEVNDLIAENIDAMLDDMYAHFLSFPETRAFFPSDEVLKRAQAAQRMYFLRLTKGGYDKSYVAERLMVGATHYRIGLDPTWYLGAYNRVMTWLRQMVAERYKDDNLKFLQVISALTRLVFFDMGLAIEAYSIAKEADIREKQEAIVRLESETVVTKSIMQNAPIGIIRLDPELTFVECNAEFAEILDRKREQIVAHSLAQVSPFFDAAVLQHLIESKQPVRRVAEKLNLSDDEGCPPQYYDWAAWPVENDQKEVTAVLGIFSNVTSRVLLQQQREDFVATLTHDLKTPVIAANRAIKLLIDGDFGKVEESQIKILETIHQSNEALYKLVQTLLDVYRYDSGEKQLNIGLHDLGQLITAKVAELEPLAKTREIALTANIPAAPMVVSCDADEIRRVIQNLLDNALKFTSPGGSIVVGLEQVGNGVRVTVTDTGIGISETDRPKLFQRFWAAAGSGRYYASTGLGLYLCRRIVESHGGRIGADSKVGIGSSFYFTLSNTPDRSS